MSRDVQMIALLLLTVVFTDPVLAVVFAPKFDHSGRWLGPDWWARPVYDWQMNSGKMIAVAALRREACLLPYEIRSNSERSSFDATVTVQFSKTHYASSDSALQAGFAFGRKGLFSDFRAALTEDRSAYYAIVSASGVVEIELTSMSPATKVIAKTSFPAGMANLKSNIVLRLKMLRFGGGAVRVTLSVNADFGKKTVERKVSAVLRDDSVSGGISLATNGEHKFFKGGNVPLVSFSKLRLDGPMLVYYKPQTFGPILWTQYSLSNNELRLQAQLAPLPITTVSLMIRPSQSDKWQMVSTAKSDALSRTAVFVEKWNKYSDIDVDYVVRLKWFGSAYTWAGTVRKEPKYWTDKLKLGVFSCDEGYMFPQSAAVSQVLRQNPDVVAYLGDQLYEYVGGYGTVTVGPLEISMLDFLQKWYRFGWQWRDVLKDRPSVILPDDHDVFQPNLWGSGGKTLPPKKSLNYAMGGYEMPITWVNAVERCHMGHLPPNPMKLVAKQGLQARFTSVLYGGIDFAVLEDRKFKTGPMELASFKRREGKDANLLGSKQEAFLGKWAKKRGVGITMKVAFSRTIFSNPTTHAEKSKKLKRSKYIFDSSAWPRHARDRVVRVLGDNNVFGIHGDQHYGILIKQGVKKYGDAGYALMVPGVATGFMRGCWPGVSTDQPASGRVSKWKFVDDSGAPVEIVGVANPSPQGASLRIIDGVPAAKVAYAKGSGYGLVTFDKKKFTAKVEIYRVGKNNEVFQGFPLTIYIGGQSSKNAVRFANQTV